MERFPAQRVVGWLSANAALLSLCAVLTGVIILYSPTLDDPFHGDDYIAFVDFKTKSFLAYSEDVVRFEDSNFYWRPLGKIFHRVLYEAFGLNALVFRLVGLGTFLFTLAALYAFCRREQFSHEVALAATIILGVLPNHVVSVAWVTNTSRLMAVLFFLICLLLLQQSGRRRIAWEVAALIAFIAAVLSDETALALAPIPVLYATLLRDAGVRWAPALGRAAVYGLLVVLLVPLQFSHTLDDEARLAFYGPGPHMVTQGWALVSQLVLPLTPPEPWEVMLASISESQWAAALIAIVAGAALFFAGSMKLRFLILWTALALSPFCLWGVLYTSPRYVYMAAVPYSIVLAWLLSEGFLLVRGAVAEHLRSPLVVPLSRALVAGVATLCLVLASTALLARNAVWSRETETWGTLTSELRREAPDLEPGSRLILFYSIWPESWARAAVWTVYGDHSLRVQVIPPYRLDVEYGPFNDRDVVFYRVGDQLLPSSIHGARR